MRYSPATTPGTTQRVARSALPVRPDDISTSLELASEPGRPLRAIVSGVALDAARAGEWLHDLARGAGAGARLVVGDPVPFTVAKRALAASRQDVGDGRLRSEYFARSMPAGAVTELIALLSGGDGRHRRRLTFTLPRPLLDRPAAYWGTNHARLAAVKRAYGPQHVFDFPQSL